MGTEVLHRKIQRLKIHDNIETIVKKEGGSRSMQIVEYVRRLHTRSNRI